MNTDVRIRLTRRFDLTPMNHKPTKDIVDITVAREPVKIDPKTNPNVLKINRTLCHLWWCNSSSEKTATRPHMTGAASQLRFCSNPGFTVNSPAEEGDSA